MTIVQPQTAPAPRSAIPTAQRGSVMENLLLREVTDRKALYNSITRNNQTQAIAVILILRIRPVPNFSISSATLGSATTTASKHLDPIDELKLFTHAREVLERNHLFDDTFGKVKFDDHRIFAICDDPIIAMEKMLLAQKYIHEEFGTDPVDDGPESNEGSPPPRSSIKTNATDPTVGSNANNNNKRSNFNRPLASVSLSGGCAMGGLFELTNDYFGNPVNIASKLAEDTANPGELLVSFNGDELLYIQKMNKRNSVKNSKGISPTFAMNTVDVSGVTIDYYVMAGAKKKTREEGEGLSFFQKLFCCHSSGSLGNTGGNSGKGNTATAPEINAKSIVFNQEERPHSVQFASTTQGNEPNNGLTIIDENDQVINDSSTINPARPKTPPGTKWEEIVMLQSDLSGFTRLTKKYGILHFMTLILNCRKVFNKHFQKYNGQLLKYDGDNIVCKFTNSTDAIQYGVQVSKDIDAYNDGKEKDHQIRVKIGMGKGLVLISEDGDIAGDGWEDCCMLSEGLAEVGEILVSEAIKQDLDGGTNRLNCKFEPRAETEEMGAHYNVTFS
jgi:class 3 adenylate cyclase